MSLIHELQRRNVIRVGLAYAVAAWLIIQIVETIFPAFGFSDKAVRIVVIIMGIGFLPAVIAAWVFQFTTDGLKLDGDAPGTARTAGSDRMLDRAITVTLLLGISFFAFDKFVLAPERAAVREAAVAKQAAAEARVGFYGDRSIAVIPFDNMSSDPEQEYFVDGIAEEVLNLLAKIRELRVISRSSAFAFKGQNLEIPDIAERLDVAHILEGSVRKVGNTVRVTAQLIEATTDTHLWSKTYERDLDDVFAIQDEIAADVARNLEITLLEPLPKSRYVDPEVIALTAQAEQLNQTRPDGVGRKIYTLASRALEIDPEHIPALSMMVLAYWFETDTTWEESQRKIDETYERIRELDPDNADPDYYYSFMLTGANKLEEAAAMYSRALEKDLTMADGIRLAGYFAMQVDKRDVAVRLFRYALATDPLCHQCRRRYAETLMYAGDYANAQWEFERYLAASSEGWDAYVLTLLLQGKTGEALAYIDSVDIDVGVGDFDAEWVDKTVREMRAMALYSLGDFDGADRELEELMAMQVRDERSLMFGVTRVAAWMGKNDLAFDNLFEMAATQFQYLRRRTFSPVWQNLHGDPRWLEYREFNGTSAERLHAIEFDPDLPE
jgi:adenylate cyclase